MTEFSLVKLIGLYSETFSKKTLSQIFFLNFLKFLNKTVILQSTCECPVLKLAQDISLREKCPNAELFVVRIQSEYRKIRTRNNSVFGHFSRSVSNSKIYCVSISWYLRLRANIFMLHFSCYRKVSPLTEGIRMFEMEHLA